MDQLLLLLSNLALTDCFVLLVLALLARHVLRRHILPAIRLYLVRRQTKNFLDLPAKIRIRIYEQVILGVERPSVKGSGDRDPKGRCKDYPIVDSVSPTSCALHASSGFILLCWQVHNEFEHEALKAVNEFLHGKLQGKWLQEPGPPLKLPSPARLSETIKMDIGIPLRNHKLSIRAYAVNRSHPRNFFFHTLLENISSFTLYPWSDMKPNF